MVRIDAAAPPRARATARARHRRRHRLQRTIVALIVVVAVAIAGTSFARATLVSNGDPFGTKATEWVRDHHFGWAVDRVERYWYGHHQPKVGGQPSGGIPRLASGARRAATAPEAGGHGRAKQHRNTLLLAPPPPCPANVKPVVANPLPGEGVWQPAGRPHSGVCFAYLRPDPVHTSVVVGAAWMNMALLRATLHNGTSVPGGGPWSAGPAIATTDFGRVAAAFNSGFRLDASRGGYMTEGRTVQPLVDGRASLVIFADGRVDIGRWGRDDALGPKIVSVRQNLDLIVDGRQVVPGLADGNSAAWGATLGNQIYTWRSGIGIDAKHDLVYVGGPGMSVQTLAGLLQRAGAVRAMELDINPEWVSFMTYTGDNPANISAKKLLADMERPPDRYLHAGSRDFVELDARS
jgi:Phosphodiester glycosidase